MEALKYPIGTFTPPDTISDEKLKEWITILEVLPAQLRDMVSEMKDEQLDTPYRPEGWTVRQVVHHVADSHHHSYIRFKWALTEDNPTIKPYLEKEWTNLPDLDGMPVEWSLRHLEAVHYKLVRLLRSLSDEQLERTFIHPDGNKTISLRQNVGQYAWHGMHHYMHIANLVKREGWT
ncbi:YfiT family bacillithiol transferase [uncultured Dokdonia sp.]|uniref:YfiT family bacillithiol transferase n=1 Tax=uncultured Dokdonia sp. TaxID=575653 RepID=UPI00261D3BEF|nr:bacillithiol transferase BstA [uncultured Dokdonia sp.]